jgi:hypothetical protein
MDLMILIAVGGLVLYKFYVTARSKPDSLACLEAGDKKPALPPVKKIDPYRGHGEQALACSEAIDLVGCEIKLPGGKYEMILDCNKEPRGVRDQNWEVKRKYHIVVCVLRQDDQYAYAEIVRLKLRNTLLVGCVLKVPLADIARMKVLSTIEQREQRLRDEDQRRRRKELKAAPKREKAAARKRLKEKRELERSKKFWAEVDAFKRENLRNFNLLDAAEYMYQKAKPAPDGEDGPFIGQKFWINDVTKITQLIDPLCIAADTLTAIRAKHFYMFPGGVFVPVEVQTDEKGDELIVGVYEYTADSGLSRSEECHRRKRFRRKTIRNNDLPEWRERRALVVLNSQQRSILQPDPPEYVRRRQAEEKDRRERHEIAAAEQKFMSELITSDEQFRRIQKSLGKDSK